jgi:hypothetical protein
VFEKAFVEYKMNQATQKGHGTENYECQLASHFMVQHSTNQTSHSIPYTNSRKWELDASQHKGRTWILFQNRVVRRIFGSMREITGGLDKIM